MVGLQRDRLLKQAYPFLQTALSNDQRAESVPAGEIQGFDRQRPSQRRLALEGLEAVVDFSERLDAFFAGRLRQEIESDGSRRWESLYTIFAGGDDLVMVGPCVNYTLWKQLLIAPEGRVSPDVSAN